MKLSPHDINAEGAVLSAALNDEWAVSVLLEKLTPEHFYNHKHQLIFECIGELFEDGLGIDIVSLIDRLKIQGRLKNAGGTEYISEISELTLTGASTEQHCKILHDKFILRKLLNVSNQLKKDIQKYQQEADPEVLLEQVEKEIININDMSTKKTETLEELGSKVMEEVDSAMKSDEHIVGLPTGFYYLDKVTNGFEEGEFIVLAGRPSMGKTSFALNAIRYNLLQGKSIALFSLESSNEKIYRRLASAMSEVPQTRIKQGKLDQKELFKLTGAMDKLNELNLYMDSTYSNSLTDIRSRTMALIYQYGIDMVVVDNLSLMVSPGNGSRTEQITRLSRNSKIMAKQLGIPVLMIHQLSRAPENRTKKRPRLADLRQSGSIEQDADKVLLMYRDEYYNDRTEKPGIAEVNVAKNRDGSGDIIDLKWRPEILKFESI